MITLLGPQRLQPILNRELEAANIEGSVATITAGWQERESELDDLGDHVARPLVNLRLYDRAEDVFRRDHELFAAYRSRQAVLKQLQKIYRLRLDYTLGAAEDLMRRAGDAALLDPERESAMAMVRALDDHHRRRIAEVHEEFWANWRPSERDSVADHRREIQKQVGPCGAVAVAGGHVAILLNRLRLFGVAEFFADRPVFAWSAGAMVLGSMVVLFHDHPPQGQGYAEVLESGLGLYRGLLPLPHARHRLRLEDPVRVALLARRYPQEQCLAMDEGAKATWNGGVVKALVGQRLAVSGAVEEVSE